MIWQLIVIFSGPIFQGFLVGAVVRLLFAMMFRTAPSFGGIFRTGLLVAIIFVVLEIIIILNV